MRARMGLAAVVALQLAAGLALQVVVVAQLGAGRETDLFVAAQAVPAMLFAVLSAPLQNLWFPNLSVAADDDTRWRSELSTALGQSFLLFGLIALLLGVTSEHWVPAFLPGFTDALHERTQQLTWLLLAAAVFNGHSAVYTQALRAREQFMPPELINATCSIAAVLACIFLVPSHGIEGAAVAVLLRSVVATGWLAARCGLVVPNVLRGWKVKGYWQRLGVLISGGSICETVVLVDRYLGSLAPAGGMTAYNLAKQGMSAGAVVIERSLTVPFMPSAARGLAAGQTTEVSRSRRRLLLRILAATALVGGVLVMVLPVWDLALSRALRLESNIASQVWWICVWLLGYLMLMPAIAANVSMLFAMGDTRSANMISIGCFFIECGLKWGLFHWMGLAGLALASSTALLFNFLAGHLLVGRRMRELRAVQ